ncbi:hypothetical protein AVEN_175189-1 [Araneus ventricosus]|uniref:Uncharacterized protein n=1 Tax=Araneus ventricosus TaxID=182803 RepID=A0A4Y2HHF8_ARAVE|nr:hypothetical protein AVEN_175189-1 [Araneus ventricosus]
MKHRKEGHQKLPMSRTLLSESRQSKELVEKVTETKAEDFIVTVMDIHSEVMKFIDNIPNDNLRKDNRKTLREYMVDFMSVVARQQAVMCMILGKYHEQTELIEDKLQKLQSTNEESIQKNISAVT